MAQGVLRVEREFINAMPYLHTGRRGFEKNRDNLERFLEYLMGGEGGIGALEKLRKSAAGTDLLEDVLLVLDGFAESLRALMESTSFFSRPSFLGRGDWERKTDAALEDLRLLGAEFIEKVSTYRVVRDSLKHPVKKSPPPPRKGPPPLPGRRKNRDLIRALQNTLTVV